jgi:hypothetical protein
MVFADMLVRGDSATCLEVEPVGDNVLSENLLE